MTVWRGAHDPMSSGRRGALRFVVAMGIARHVGHQLRAYAERRRAGAWNVTPQVFVLGSTLPEPCSHRITGNFFLDVGRSADKITSCYGRRTKWIDFLAGFLALFLVALVTIMFQVLRAKPHDVVPLRLHSHLIAMFGMTIGALAVFCVRRGRQCWLAPWGGAPFCAPFHVARDLLAYLALFPKPGEYIWPSSSFVCAVPFVFAGIFVCLALTRFPRMSEALCRRPGGRR
jgi:hypothetical protein